MVNKKTETLSIKITPELKNNIKNEADITYRTMNSLVILALNFYFNEKEKNS